MVGTWKIKSMCLIFFQNKERKHVLGLLTKFKNTDIISQK